MSGGLRKNTLSIIDTMTLAVAGTAPSYTLNATTATLIGAAGLASPAALLYGAIPMLGISFAFMHLNRWRADAGAAYAWVGRSLNPSLGFFCAWIFLTLSTAFMVAASLPVGVITLNLIAPQYEDKAILAMTIGGLWFAGVATLTLLGIQIAAGFQKLMTGIEIISSIALAIGAIAKFSVNPVHPFSWQWFAPTVFNNDSTFLSGLLIGMYYYYGWDITSNVAEESSAEAAPGRSGIFGVLTIFLLYLSMQVIVQMGMSTEAIEQHGTALLLAIGDAVLPNPWGKVAILAVLVSTIGAIETQMTCCTRLLFSMGRDRVISRRFEQIHPRFETPWFAGLGIMILVLVLMVFSSSSTSISFLMTSLISSIGILVSFYYGMAGIACTWYYRKTLSQNFQTLFVQGIWSLSSAGILLSVGVLQLLQLDRPTAAFTIGAIASGLVPMLFYRFKYQSKFYSSSLEHHNPQQTQMETVKLRS